MKANIPKGYGQGPQNMQSMLRQAQKLQEQMDTLRAELDTREYEVKAGGGAVTVKIDGKHTVKSIEISPEIVDPDDIETLSDIMVAAVNEAIRRVDSENEREMNALTGGSPLGGALGDNFGGMGGMGGLGGGLNLPGMN